MYTCNFIHKLKKLNPKIYLKSEGVRYQDTQLAGIWLREPRKKRKILERGADKRGRESAAGHIDKMLSSVSVPEVPEYEVLGADREHIAHRGWRTIVLALVNKKVFTLAAARAEFSRSLGEQHWDNTNYEYKLNALRKEVLDD